jgi:AcrR family transcriptional regulator
MDATVDARQVKTSAKLTEVILRLAADRLASELTVSEVTIAAGINRSTFYQHAVSPTDLLENVLRAELDAIRDAYFPTGEGLVDPSALDDTTRAVLRHVESHAAIYTRGLGAGSASSSLHPLLSRHFEESVALLLRQHNVALPVIASATASAPVGGAFLASSAARFIADGTVGAIDVWLRTPEPRSVEEFSAAYALFLPAWWPLAA